MPQEDEAGNRCALLMTLFSDEDLLKCKASNKIMLFCACDLLGEFVRGRF